MRIKLIQYILSVILLSCLAFKTSAPLIHITSHNTEFVEQFSTENETKEIEKLYEIEVFIQSVFSYLFVSNSIELNFIEKKHKLPFIHFQLHYPPPNVLI
ncbi:hypothetical protein [Sphingobacterium bovistauri]|uniref:Lipoprotein n=1 Tax=Sphingobacterium bovistauri TaxID=2781959 RepID=A0ABS7Z7D2_9SPHI|nr:hypothetical protein [Sphingobacterium bovistauri]MCA5005507.1 hypothetical protein [Sphingobacterium bovistauri]